MSVIPQNCALAHLYPRLRLGSRMGHAIVNHFNHVKQESISNLLPTSLILSKIISSLCRFSSSLRPVPFSVPTSLSFELFVWVTKWDPLEDNCPSPFVLATFLLLYFFGLAELSMALLFLPIGCFWGFLPPIPHHHLLSKLLLCCYNLILLIPYIGLIAMFHILIGFLPLVIPNHLRVYNTMLWLVIIAPSMSSLSLLFSSNFVFLPTSLDKVKVIKHIHLLDRTPFWPTVIEFSYIWMTTFHIYLGFWLLGLTLLKYVFSSMDHLPYIYIFVYIYVNSLKKYIIFD